MKILVADDDPVTLEAVCTCLRDDGFSPLPAADGLEAVEVWRREKPSLLCLDIMMPRLDGFGVCRQVRAADGTVPILFVSAKNEEIDVVVGLELGADDFIRKPFGKRELLARVRAALRRGSARQGAAARTFAMQDLEVFPDELRAVRGGSQMELTPREISLLRVLHEHAGRPVPRDTFLDRCWGIDYYPESRTLDQHIAQLRRKIERDPDNPAIIETVRGVGYRFRG